MEHLDFCLENDTYSNNYYKVFENGYIVRTYFNDKSTDTGSDNWMAKGVMIQNLRGPYSHFMSWNRFFNNMQNKEFKNSMYFKNGNSRVRLVDLDHGDEREWGTAAVFTSFNN